MVTESSGDGVHERKENQGYLTDAGSLLQYMPCMSLPQAESSAHVEPARRRVRGNNCHAFLCSLPLNPRLLYDILIGTGKPTQVVDHLIRSTTMIRMVLGDNTIGNRCLK